LKENKYSLKPYSMKRIIAFLFFCIPVVAISAQDSTNFLKVEVQSKFRSKYVGPNGSEFYSKPVVQSFVNLEHAGLYLELWNSKGFNNWSTDFSDEIDYTLGYSGTLYPLSLNVSMSYFDNFRVFSGSKNDVVKGYIGLDFAVDTTGWFKLTTFVSSAMYITPSKKTEFSGGTIVSVGLNNEISVRKLKLNSLVQLTLDDGVFQTRDENGVFGKKGGFMFKFSTGLNLILSKHFNLNIIEITTYSPLGKRGMPNQFVNSSGISCKF
jgi:hypothetical protein